MRIHLLSPFLLLSIISCTGPETITETISPAYTARECVGPSPQMTEAWLLDLRKSGVSHIPLPKPVCEDVAIPEETQTRPVTWGERLGWGVAPPPSSYHHSGCGLAPTDQQTGVIFCARDNDRDETRGSPDPIGCTGDCSDDPEPPAPTPQPPAPGMMGPGD